MKSMGRFPGGKGVLAVLKTSLFLVFASYGEASYAASTAVPPKDENGLVKAEGYQLVKAHCSACHSPSLIVQNHMRRERWIETIRWMQATQKLWPLGDAEPAILDYLETWYGPKTQYRRPPLQEALMPPKTQ